MHRGLKRNHQLMPGAQWLALLCRHIPDRYEHLPFSAVEVPFLPVPGCTVLLELWVYVP